MNLFKSLTLAWWQVGLFKLCLISFGIILGVYWHDFFLQWIVLVTIAFVAPAIYIATVWFKE